MSTLQRRRLVLALSVLGIPTAMAVIVACEDESSTTPGPAVPTAPTTTTSPTTNPTTSNPTEDSGLPDGNPPPPSGSIGTCKEYLAANPGAPSGKYTLDLDGPNGTAYPPISIYCDNTFEGGGWTLIQSFNDDGRSAGQFGVADDAGYYLAAPPEPGKVGGLGGWIVKAIAERSSQLHIRTSFQSDAGADGGIWISSKAPDAGGTTRVMFNLRNLDVTTKGTDGGFEEWTGPQATATKLAWVPLYGGGPGTCGTPVEQLKYPSIYWACGNFSSMNLMHPQSLARWTYQPNTGNDPMEVYVR